MLHARFCRSKTTRVSESNGAPISTCSAAAASGAASVAVMVCTARSATTPDCSSSVSSGVRASSSAPKAAPMRSGTWVESSEKGFPSCERTRSACCVRSPGARPSASAIAGGGSPCAKERSCTSVSRPMAARCASMSVRSPVTGRAPLPPATKVPAPGLRCTSPSLARPASARRTVMRERPCADASAGSPGSCSPGARTPETIRSFRSRYSLCVFDGSMACKRSPP